MRTTVFLLIVLAIAALLAEPAEAQWKMNSYAIQKNTAFLRATSDTSAAYYFGGAHHISALFIVTDTVDVVREFQYRENSDGTWTEMARDSVVQLAASGTTLLQDEYVIRSNAADAIITGGGQFRVIHRWKDHANNGATGGTFKEIIYAK